MLRLYRAADLVEATLLRDLLTQARIEVFLFNEHAQAGAGQLPVTEVWPEIWLKHDDDLALARTLVAAFEQREQRGDVEQRCRQCGEANPAAFELCWSCHAAL